MSDNHSHNPEVLSNRREALEAAMSYASILLEHGQSTTTDQVLVTAAQFDEFLNGGNGTIQELVNPYLAEAYNRGKTDSEVAEAVEANAGAAEQAESFDPTQTQKWEYETYIQQAADQDQPDE